MPILRAKEIRNMSHEDRMKRLDEFRTELQRLRTMIGAGGTIENPARIKQLRKTSARILTIDSEPMPEPKKETKKTKTKAKAKAKTAREKKK